MLVATLRLRESPQRRFLSLSVCSGRVGRVREEDNTRDLEDGFGSDEKIRRGRERRGGRVSLVHSGAGVDADVGVGSGGGRRERDWPIVASKERRTSKWNLDQKLS